MSTFAGKVALVTGGGTGIGKSITEGLVAAGAKVVITGRRLEPLQAVQGAHPDNVALFQADVTKAGDPAKAVSFAIETFGQLDVLVNNAGAFLAKPITETSDDELAQMLNVNVAGVYTFTREAIPHLTKTKGNIVNISSVVATGVMAGTSAYSASKAAVDHLTRLLGAELGPAGIRVNTISPGLTRTDMSAGMLSQSEMEQAMAAQTPLGRIGEAEDIAKAVLYVASEQAEWVTGQILASSGGLLL